MISTHPRTTASACAACIRCCQEHRVPLTVFDIQRLAEALKSRGEITDREELLARLSRSITWCRPDELGLQAEPESWVMLHRHGAIPVLSQNEQGCRFLVAEKERENGHGCSIHAQRPLACQSYPFDRDERRKESDEKLHPSQSFKAPSLPRGLALHPQVLCPTEQSPLTILNREKALDIVKQRDQELASNAFAVAQFNQRIRSLKKLGRRRLEARHFYLYCLSLEPEEEGIVAP
ncbi:MAG: YkgJ family cysteine cluster protein [Polyangiaceae bacterium]|nr:YkgJ family cysteine cluster protein [Polyangiaceae bacterium]